MANTYLLPKAYCIETRQSVKIQDLTGARLELRQRGLAEDLARQLAAKMAQRTGDPWQGYVEVYTPSERS